LISNRRGFEVIKRSSAATSQPSWKKYSIAVQGQQPCSCGTTSQLFNSNWSFVWDLERSSAATSQHRYYAIRGNIVNNWSPL